MSGSTNTRTMAIVVWSLYIANVIVPFAALVGVIIAYVSRGDAKDTVYFSHFQRQITLFWVGLVVGILGALLTLVFIGWIVLLLLLIYWLVISIKGLLRVLDDRPMDKSPVISAIDQARES